MTTFHKVNWISTSIRWVLRHSFFFLLPLLHYNSTLKKCIYLSECSPKKIKDPIHNLQTPGVKTVKKTTSVVHKIFQTVLRFNDQQLKPHTYLGNSVRGKEGKQKKKVNAALLYSVWKEVRGFIYLFIIIIRRQNQSSYCPPKLKDLKFQTSCNNASSQCKNTNHHLINISITYYTEGSGKQKFRSSVTSSFSPFYHYKLNWL